MTAINCDYSQTTRQSGKVLPPRPRDSRRRLTFTPSPGVGIVTVGEHRYVTKKDARRLGDGIAKRYASLLAELAEE